MKIAIYIKEGRKQAVLTPENDFEKDALEMFPVTKFTGLNTPPEEPRGKIKFYRGEFYDCQGGWTRESKSTDSLILVVEDEKPHTNP